MNFLFLVSSHALFSGSFLPCLVTTGLGEEAAGSESPLKGALEGDWTAEYRIKSGLLRVHKSANVQTNSSCLTIRFFIGLWICFFSTKKNILVGSSYPQLHWIVSLITFLEEGLENMLWSWRSFPLTDLHTSEHLCTLCS